MTTVTVIRSETETCESNHEDMLPGNAKNIAFLTASICRGDELTHHVQSVFNRMLDAVIVTNRGVCKYKIVPYQAGGSPLVPIQMVQRATCLSSFFKQNNFKVNIVSDVKGKRVYLASVCKISKNDEKEAWIARRLSDLPAAVVSPSFQIQEKEPDFQVKEKDFSIAVQPEAGSSVPVVRQNPLENEEYIVSGFPDKFSSMEAARDFARHQANNNHGMIYAVYQLVGKVQAQALLSETWK